MKEVIEERDRIAKILERRPDETCSLYVKRVAKKLGLKIVKADKLVGVIFYPYYRLPIKISDYGFVSIDNIIKTGAAWTDYLFKRAFYDEIRDKIEESPLIPEREHAVVLKAYNDQKQYFYNENQLLADKKAAWEHNLVYLAKENGYNRFIDEEGIKSFDLLIDLFRIAYDDELEEIFEYDFEGDRRNLLQEGEQERIYKKVKREKRAIFEKNRPRNAKLTWNEYLFAIAYDYEIKTTYEEEFAKQGYNPATFEVLRFLYGKKEKSFLDRTPKVRKYLIPGSDFSQYTCKKEDIMTPCYLSYGAKSTYKTPWIQRSKPSDGV
ncbi:MAG: hypothetical protein LBD41_04415, partial [Clostridiales Family XIII bacterium]|nr:hypothetical protein [Clostridiales Family XIII bacterium]